MRDGDSCSPAPVIPLLGEAQALQRLKGYSAAEDFFVGLGVPYDAKLLAVARLHILKRMGEYLAAEDLDGLPDRVVVARCRTTLERAYQDFAQSGPLQQRVFKVLKSAVAPSGGSFVPLDDLG